MFRKINYTQFANDLSGSKQVLFIRPFICRTVRVHPLHQSLKTTGQYDDVRALLDRTCSRFIKGIWFYNPEHHDRLHEALETLFNLEVENYLVEEEGPKFGHNDSNHPIQEILN